MLQTAIPGVTDDAEDHDLLQALIHVPGGHTENVNSVWIIFGTHTAPRAGLNSCTTWCLLAYSLRVGWGVGGGCKGVGVHEV